MISICDFPHDIFINHIITNIKVPIVENLASVSKTMYCQKEELVKISINSNVFVPTYTQINPDDLLNVIKKSIFTYQSFQQILESIRKKDKNAITVDFTNIETSEDSINNTFRIFQLLETYAIESQCNASIGNIISWLLINYFDELFKKRSGFKTFDSSVIGYCLRNENLNWHKIDINPYYIYENMNYIPLKKRSINFRQNMENESGFIMKDIYKYQVKHLAFQVETLSFIIHITTYGYNDDKVYVFYELIRYINNITDFHHHCYISDNVIMICISKINDFRYQIRKNIDKKPAFFKKIVITEFDKFLEMNKK